MPDPVQLAQRFVECINAHDVDGLAALMSPDHRFIDSLGAEANGVNAMREGWRAYYRMVPDYRIDVEQAFVEGPQVILVGSAHGTYSRDGSLHAADRWSMPAAWRALIRDGRVAEWQVYADNEPIRRCMARAPA